MLIQSNSPERLRASSNERAPIEHAWNNEEFVKIKNFENNSAYFDA